MEEEKNEVEQGQATRNIRGRGGGEVGVLWCNMTKAHEQAKENE